MARITNARLYQGGAANAAGVLERAQKSIKRIQENIRELPRDRVEISDAARQRQAASSRIGAPVSLLSITGRTEAVIPTLKELNPQAQSGAPLLEYKGTRVMLDNRAVMTLRTPDIDVTVGGPDGSKNLTDSAFFEKIKAKPPKEPPVERKPKTEPKAAQIQGPARESTAKAPGTNPGAASQRTENASSRVRTGKSFNILA